MFYRTVLFLLCSSLIVSGCATKQVKVEDQHARAECSEILVRQIDYSPKGLPLFLDRLSERPNKAGYRFTLVQLANGLPAKSYDIIVAGSESDFTKPFKVVYEWTGRGFVGGAQATAFTTNIVAHGNAGNRDEAAFTLAFAIAPLVIGTAGGFVIGVADGIKTTAEEVGKVVVGKQEQVVAYTTYQYDDHGRLALTRMYKADSTRLELVLTEFTYQVDALEPQKTTITTVTDGTVRVVE